jgi:hypothetical protein
VATDPNQIDGEAQPDPNAAQPENPENQPPVDDTPPEVAGLAQRMGWVPRDQYQGVPENWKPAEQFILDGRDIQRETSRELKGVRAQLEILGKTSASIIEQQVNDRVAKLTEQYHALVDEGRTGESLQVAEQIATIKAQPITPGVNGNGPSPDAQAFADRNANWFQKPGHEDATSRAIEICNSLAAQGYKDHGQQLAIAEQRMKREYPELFKANGGGKPAPGVNQPGSRAAGSGGREKGFADMPPDAQNIAKDMVARGVIPDLNSYTKNYWLNAKGNG